ncbi:hypothetical protein BRE01_17950 [Brevibacillus reuszeri]|uniref:F5/8 type C domain-containing protein n=1 Tax=Brevibacillus reuszeri TaxID=54915 RepID=A0ABQ0TJK8_9BACL|nr:discoidin domain-containing protein [Brevibacillus reuszeri]MED1856218.1 discoidin domain-containing protein [Brevibacillus reuszeri]GED68093.1 hypothetical protein BRE01_17950 [Brevibacillus reuszeri]
MSVRIVRTGTGVVKDHHELANKGMRPHAEIDSYLQEMDDARENKPSLKARFDDLIKKDDEQDRRLNGITDGVTSIHGALTSVTNKLNAVEATNQVQDSRLSQIEQKNLQQDQAILKLQGDASSNPNAEVVAARKDRNGKIFPSLKSRLDDMQSKIGTGGNGGGGGGYLDIQTPINVMKNFFRDAEGQNVSVIQTGSVYVDVFKDGTGIDPTRSTGFLTVGGKVSGGIVDITPVMTGPNSPSPYVATASNAYDIYYAWKAFDVGTKDGYWYSYSKEAGKGTWLQIDLGEPKSVSKVDLQSGLVSGSNCGLKDWEIVGSNDGTNFEPVVKGLHPNDTSIKEYQVPAPKAYRYYRINVLTSHYTYALVKRFKLYENVDDCTIITKEISVPTGVTKTIVTSEFAGLPTFDISLNDGAIWNSVDLNKLLDLSGLSGSKMRLRATIRKEDYVESLGVTWFTDDTLMTVPSAGGGGGSKIEADPVIGSMLLYDTVNLMRTNFRQSEVRNVSRYSLTNMVIDSFKDAAGMDPAVNSNVFVSGGSLFSGFSGNIIPTMTGDTTPSGKASASSYSTAYNTYPWYAFDKNTTGTNSVWAPQNTSTGWLQYEFPSPKIVSKYTVQAPNATDVNLQGSPKNWTFEAYDDASSKWIALDTRTNETGWTPSQIRQYVFFNTKEYTKYRINITANNGHSLLLVQELGMMVSEASSPVTIAEKITNTISKIVVVAEFDGLVTFDLTIDDGLTWLKDIKLDSLVDITGSGKSIRIRMNIAEGSKVNSLGYAWFDDSVELIKITPATGGDGGGIAMIQVDKVGVVASPQFPSEVNITIPETTDFKLPPIEVLRFTPSANDQVSTVATFSSTEAWNYDHDKYVVLDGIMHLKTAFDLDVVEEFSLPSGNTVYSFTVNAEDFIDIERIEVT